MALEDLTGASKFIDALVVTNPAGADDRREGDDHIRGVKNVLKNTFPNINGAVTPTLAQINGLTRMTWNAAGTSSVSAPSAGDPWQFNSNENAARYVIHNNAHASGGAAFASIAQGVTCLVQAGAGGGIVGCTSNHPFGIITNGLPRISVSSAGAVLIPTPASGVPLTVQGNGASNFGSNALIRNSAGTDGARLAFEHFNLGTPKFWSIGPQAGSPPVFTIAEDGGPSGAGTARLTIGLGGAVTIGMGAMTTGSIQPWSDNAVSIGTSGLRTSVVYSVTGTINTSDAREKIIEQPVTAKLAGDFIRDVAKDGLAFYRWIEGGRKAVEKKRKAIRQVDVPAVLDGDGNEIEPARTEIVEYDETYTEAESVPGVRLHCGVLAQSVERAYKAVGLRDFAGHVIGEDGRHGLRYDQLIPMLYAALADALDRIDKLEAKKA